MWDQRKKLISIRILLKNVKQSEINFGLQTISFRTKVDSTDYGFDFELFDKIIPERCKQIPKNDYVVLYLEKEHQIESSSFQKQ